MLKLLYTHVYTYIICHTPRISSLLPHRSESKTVLCELQDGQGGLPMLLASFDDGGEENCVFADVQSKYLLEKVSAASPEARLRAPKERACISI